MTDGWAGFRATPKPLMGVSVEETSIVFSTSMSVAQVISILTTATGLTSWLGEVVSLKLGVGAKAKVALDEQSIEILFTCLDFPGHIVFMSESLGELDFRLTEFKSGSKVNAVIRRAVRPEEQAAWFELAEEILQRFEDVAINA